MGNIELSDMLIICVDEEGIIQWSEPDCYGWTEDG